jgi:hypothetical protein
MHSHTNYIAHVTYRDMLYVPSKFEENPSKDNWMFNHALARMRALARLRMVREHEKYVALATCCDV